LQQQIDKRMDSNYQLRLLPFTLQGIRARHWSAGGECLPTFGIKIVHLSDAKGISFILC